MTAFAFELVTPEQRLFAGEATSVSVPGADGDFTVLAGHAPFIATLRPGILLIEKADGSSEEMFVQGGFADANPDGLSVLAETAMSKSDLTSGVLDGLIKQAEDDLEKVKSANVDDDTLTAAYDKVAKLGDVRAA